ncbi:GtrA family protein [Candidatus Binatus soli]|uniref:GtrA family protein n=1 Tax=Candidatus Binatus soli TaxID=1953413 RepID=UPI003D106533
MILILYLKLRQMASREFSGWDGGNTLARDMALALIVGFLTGALSIPVVINLGLGTAIRIPLLYLPVIGATLFAIAVLAASLVANRAPSLFEFSKFAVVGVLNSGVDFGVLNSLMLITGVSSGGGFLAFKSVSVTLGVINSYLWNKYWTFDSSKSGAARRELVAFLVVTLVAVALNVVGADVIVNVVGAPRGISTKLWANVGAISGAGLTLFANFFGYKFFVFRKLSVVT